jgi:DNA-binding NarL/FixJ family response regulator
MHHAMPAKILCIEDDAETLALLVTVLGGAGFTVATAVDGQSGLEAIVAERPDLVICDILLPRLSGFEILERLSWGPSEDGAAPFIFLTALDDRDAILKGRRLGADDYVTKPVDFDILVEIVRRRLAPAGRFLQTPVPSLSPRELEILSWVARGKSSTDIAAMIGLSDRTVDYHVENAMRKLGVSSRVQAAVKACAAKLIRI